MGDGTLWAKPPGAGQRSREGVRASSTSRVVLYKSPSVHSTDSELNIDIIDTEKGSFPWRRTPHAGGDRALTASTRVEITHISDRNGPAQLARTRAGRSRSTCPQQWHHSQPAALPTSARCTTLTDRRFLGHPDAPRPRPCGSLLADATISAAGVDTRQSCDTAASSEEQKAELQ